MIRRLIIGIVSCFFFFSLFNLEAYAKLDSNQPEINYDRLLPIAKKYIGVPYSYGGTTTKGFDCSGYITYVFNQLDTTLPRTSSGMFSTGETVSRSELRPGDLVFFNTFGSGVSHVGIYIGNDEFSHASSTKGVMISSLNDPYYWKSRYIGAKRVLDYALDTGQFHDLQKDHWAYKAVEKLNNQNISLGYEGSYYLPEETITKAEVASMLAEALGLNMSNRKQLFEDVPSNHWAVGAINALKNEGFIQGDGKNNFNPEAELKREHLAIIFTKAFYLKQAKQETNFTDVSKLSYAYDAIQRLAASGITKGYEDNTFKPDEPVKRSQFAAFLYRALYEK